MVEALSLWREWNAQQARPLFHETGWLVLTKGGVGALALRDCARSRHRLCTHGGASRPHAPRLVRGQELCHAEPPRLPAPSRGSRHLCARPPAVGLDGTCLRVWLTRAQAHLMALTRRTWTATSTHTRGGRRTGAWWASWRARAAPRVCACLIARRLPNCCAACTTLPCAPRCSAARCLPRPHACMNGRAHPPSHRSVLGVRTADGRVCRTRGPLRADDPLAPRARVIVCSGAWTPRVVPQCAPLLKPVAQPLVFIRPSRPEKFQPPAFTGAQARPHTPTSAHPTHRCRALRAVFGAATSQTGYYGFPLIDVRSARAQTRQRRLHPAVCTTAGA